MDPDLDESAGWAAPEFVDNMAEADAEIAAGIHGTPLEDALDEMI